jgi:hypothetical protein
MGCTWLPNLITYSLALIRLWRVTVGPIEYCTGILQPKPSQNLPLVSLLGPGIPNCRLPWVFSKKWTFPDVGNIVKDDSSDHNRACVSSCLMSRFYGRDATSSFTHLSITSSNHKFSDCSPTVGVGLWSSCRTVFVKTRLFKMNDLSPVLQ